MTGNGQKRKNYDERFNDDNKKNKNKIKITNPSEMSFS